MSQSSPVDHVDPRLRRRLLYALAALLFLTVVGFVGYMLIEQMAPIDALYMTVITVSTVGFGEVQRLTVEGRVFTVILIVSGVGTLGYAAARLVEYVVSGQLRAQFAQRWRELELERLSGHYIVCGYGRVGSSIASSLTHAAKSVVVIDSAAARCERARADGFACVEGNAAASETLNRVGLLRAAGVLVATGYDAENVYTVLAVRVLVPTVTLVARANSPEAVERLQAAGANRVFSPSAEGAQSMATYVLSPQTADVVDELLDPRSLRLGIQEVALPATSPLLGKTPHDLDLAEEYEVVLITISRDGELLTIPAPSVALQAGDVLVFVGRPASVQRFIDACAREGTAALSAPGART